MPRDKKGHTHLKQPADKSSIFWGALQKIDISQNAPDAMLARGN